MARFIEERHLKWTLFHAKGTGAKLTKANLEDWEEELREKYEGAMQQEMPRHNIDDTVANRSVIVLLAQIGHRLGHRRSERIEKACEFFNRSRATVLPGPPPPPAPVPV